MKNSSILLTLIYFCFSLTSFAQLDSVYYQGPLFGSVSSGAIQNTDNFTDELSINGELRENPSAFYLYPDENNSTIIGFDGNNSVPSIYIQDNTSFNSGSALGGQEVILKSFLGISMTNFIPPDPSMAVGPNHIIVCANSVFKIFDKQGNVLKTIGAGGWWGPISPYESGDPQVIYDHYAGRWVLVWMEVNNSPAQYGDLVAYSDDDNPLGEWYIYRLPLNSWGDYPKLGFDDEAIYIMSRQISNGFYQYNLIRILNKAEFYASNGGQVTYNDLYNIRVPNQGSGSAALDVIRPSVSYTLGSGGWFLWARGSLGPTQSANYYALYKVTNPLTNPGLRGKTFTVPLYFTPPNANQLGGGNRLETIGWMSGAPVVRDGFLYAVHDMRSSTNTTYSSIKYLKIDLNTPSLVENIEYGNDGYFYLYPGLTVDTDHNVTITFSRSGINEYAGAYFSTKLANELVINPSVPLAEGQGNYDVTFGSGRNRWGDYLGIFLDPVNEKNVWMLTEFASATNTWGTQVGEVIPGPFTGIYAYLKPGSINFNEVETGTESQVNSVTLANYGEDDLIINDIPSTFNEFNLVTNISYPYTIASFDSLTLEFSFSPTSEGSVSVIYPVTSNDSNFDGVPVSGSGYDLAPALLQTFYATTGSRSNGVVITIDFTTGNGTNIGSSTFNEVTSISIDPTSGKLYGLVTGTITSDLVKINADEGDAHLLHTIDILSMAAIAFDTTGALYGITRNGDLYTIDKETCTTNFIVDAEGTYLSITFHPETNELWATSRAFLPPNNETIFKVNLSTGDTTIIGLTGLGKPTNAIAFDANLDLYGVIGTSSQIGDFVSINTTNGSGEIVGSIGIQNVLGLAYLDQLTTDVEDDESGINPTEYSLEQNYPNPFNPNTRIEFSLPIESSLKLAIYNILGQEVVILVDGDMTAGNHSITWNAKDATGKQLTSGIYLYKMTALSIDGIKFNETKKMILLK